MFQSQKGAEEHTWICQVDCLKCGISGETTIWHTEILKKELKVAGLEISPQRSLPVPWTPTVPQTSMLKYHRTRGSALISQKPSAIYRVCIAKHGLRPKTFISLHILLLQDTALLKALAKKHTGGGKNGWAGQMVGLWMLKGILRELTSMT